MSDLSSLALFAFASLALASVLRPEMLLITPHSATQGCAAGFGALALTQTGIYRHILACVLAPASFLKMNGVVSLAASKIAKIIPRHLKIQLAAHYLLRTVFVGIAQRLA